MFTPLRRHYTRRPHGWKRHRRRSKMVCIVPSVSEDYFVSTELKPALWAPLQEAVDNASIRLESFFNERRR